jgi:DNA-binding beta-propeller fold protein YncE
MRSRLFSIVAAALAVAALLAAQAVSAQGKPGSGNAVFVQTNELDGNHVAVFERGGDGLLTPAGSYATGGNGGAAAPGTVSDRLASQGSLVYDDGLLFAVNAGSDSVSVFKAQGSRLQLADVVPSGGDFPASVAVNDDLVYVLNAGGSGILQGFEIRGHRLRPL